MGVLKTSAPFSAWKIGFGLTVVLACRQSAVRPPAADDSQRAKPACAVGSNALGHSEPQQAYQRYVEALNAAHWCDAIAMFSPAGRSDMVVSTFKGLLLMAGTDNPNRAKYAQQLQAFCAEHGLDYASGDTLVTLTVSLLNKVDIDTELAPLRRIEGTTPEVLYAELMTQLAAVDAASMVKFEPALNDLDVSGDTATGIATGKDGRRIKVHFVKTPAGWYLSER
jgi:hypothetical protein